MALDEFLKLDGEGAYPMMLLLPGNVGSYLCDIGFQHFEKALLFPAISPPRLATGFPRSIPEDRGWKID